MRTITPIVWRLAAILTLVVLLSGCVFGDRLRSFRKTEQPQTQPIQSETQSAAPSGESPSVSTGTATPQSSENNGVSGEVVSPEPTGDTQMDDLLNLIITLDAANQAGDSLEDLP